MYAKLFSRITESSLMEEDIAARYVFMMLLAIADPLGYVVGTDVAIARRLNMPVDELKACLDALMAPDANSNSKEHDGRRVLASDLERGYMLVNYCRYRDMRDEDQRRDYMRAYMRNYRAEKEKADVNSSKQCKLLLAKADEESTDEAKETNNHPADLSPPPAPPPAKPPKERASDRAYKFADWFRLTLPPDAKPAPAWREQWAKTFDDLVRLDSRDPAEIERVAEWGRKDGFWAANFLSPAKLRQRDKAGTLFFDRFVAAMSQKRSNGNLTPAEQKEKREAGTFRLDPKSEAAKRRVWRPPNTPCVTKTAEPPAETKFPV